MNPSKLYRVAKAAHDAYHNLPPDSEAWSVLIPKQHEKWVRVVTATMKAAGKRGTT